MAKVKPRKFDVSMTCSMLTLDSKLRGLVYVGHGGQLGVHYHVFTSLNKARGLQVSDKTGQSTVITRVNKSDRETYH